MSVEQPSTSSTPSRACTTIRDSIEEAPIMVEDPASVVQGVYATPPRTMTSNTNEENKVAVLKNPMQQVITILFGEDVRSWTSIHEQTLCKHSEKMTDLAQRAAERREAHSKIDVWLEQLESITVLGEEDLDQFEKQQSRAKLIAIVLEIWEHFPVANYQKPTGKAIRDILDKQYASGNLMPSVEKPKTLKMFYSFDSTKRLHSLNSEGLLEVAEEVCTRLQKFKAAEKQLARKNSVIAWAQGRLVLRDASEKSVVALVKWAYDGTLNCDNAEHLYDVWALATRLRFDVLTEECVDRLCNAVSASFDKFSGHGIPLRALLGLQDERGPASSDDVVATMFHHVLKDDKLPKKLSELIIDALARGMDAAMWVQVRSMVSHDTCRKLIDFMIVYRDVKAEGGFDDGSLVKLETPQENLQASK